MFHHVDVSYNYFYIYILCSIIYIIYNIHNIIYIIYNTYVYIYTYVNIYITITYICTYKKVDIKNIFQNIKIFEILSKYI